MRAKHNQHEMEGTLRVHKSKRRKEETMNIKKMDQLLHVANQF